ncbi:hypothetical protein HOLleu_44801 [Holothuria leucospilota]|uniref:Uncharacterized protein n=1 Tax=Holothuria leucospilota TaxID=206669 RepID=A0A9Q1BA88_HOLLE|nr:hypothetical protein HOLleu_44801 [Holothuria leucospilota]
MEAPTDRASLQRFMGMVTYVSKFIPNLSQLQAAVQRREALTLVEQILTLRTPASGFREDQDFLRVRSYFLFPNPLGSE